MKRQLQGIALILIGILFTLGCVSDPWLPVTGDVGREMYPLITAAASIAARRASFARFSRSAIAFTSPQRGKCRFHAVHPLLGFALGQLLQNDLTSRHIDKIDRLASWDVGNNHADAFWHREAARLGEDDVAVLIMDN